MSWIPLARLVAEPIERTDLLQRALPEPWPRNGFSTLQFLSDARKWMIDCRWYNDSEVWRRRVRFLADR